MNIGDIVLIHTFDDGNSRFKMYCNKWRIDTIMYNGGKLKLVNSIDGEIQLNSISTWKTRLYNLV